MISKVESRQIERKPPADLVALAADVVAECGLEALTSRAVAERAGLTPSAVLYHFRSKDGLWDAARTVVGERVLDWFDQQAEAGDDGAYPLPTWARLGGIASAWLTALGPTLLARTELMRTPHLPPDRLSDAARQIDDEDRRWMAAGVDGDAQQPLSDIWPMLLRGSVTRLLLEGTGAPREALIQAFVQRVSQRLQGLPNFDQLAPIRIADAAPQPDRPPGKQAIVEASIRVIARHGVEGLTHRRVATEGGISIAATTYHYDTKLDIILDSFIHLQDIVLKSSVDEAVTPRQFAALALDEDGNLREILSALTALNVAAIRNPALRRLSAETRSHRGVNAVRWLRSFGIADIDFLDGIIWTSLITAVIERALLTPVEHRRRYLEETTERAFEALYRAYIPA